jgi:uroporphyrinogen decarboxylase
MNSRDRFLSALYLEEPDLVPWLDLADSLSLIKNFVKVFPREEAIHTLWRNIRKDEEYISKASLHPSEEALKPFIKPLVKAHQKLGLDAFLTTLLWDPAFTKRLDKSHYMDEWGRISSTTKQGDISDAYLGGYFNTFEKYKQYERPIPVTDWKLEYFRAVKKLVGNELSLVVACGSIFEVAMEGIGVENLPRILYTDPDYLDQFLSDNAEFTLELGNTLVDEGAEVLLIFDDYAYHSGPFISPKHWMRHVFPPTKKVVEGLHKKGVPVILHACGDIRSLMDGIIKAGYDAVHPLEATANMTLKETKERWGDNICLIGNTDINVLSLGKPEDTMMEVKEGIEAAGPGGGYIMSTSHGLYPSCKTENVIAMARARNKYGKYRR